MVALGEVAQATAAVARYIDRTEHNEPADSSALASTAGRLRQAAELLAHLFQVDLLEAYATRIAEIELRTAYEPLLPRPSEAIRRAVSWRDVQIAQLRHDRHYHPDVFGLSRRDQLVHVTLHLCKISGALAELLESDSWLDFTQRRLPDLLLFGVKMSTLAGQSLSTDAAMRS